MIFYQRKTCAGVWDGKKFHPFVDGKIETEDGTLIALLRKCGYEEVDDGKTIEGDTEGQEVKKEPTFNELRQEAKAREIEGYSKMNKQGLIEALKEGE